MGKHSSEKDLYESLYEVIATMQHDIALLRAAQCKSDGDITNRRAERARLGALSRTAAKYGLGRHEWLAVCGRHGLDVRSGKYPVDYVNTFAARMRAEGALPNDEVRHDSIAG